MLLVVVGRVLDILNQMKNFKKLMMTSTSKMAYVPLINGGNEVTPSYVKVYLSNFSQDDKIIINKKVTRKTVLCIASDNSLVSTTS